MKKYEQTGDAVRIIGVLGTYVAALFIGAVCLGSRIRGYLGNKVLEPSASAQIVKKDELRIRHLVPTKVIEYLDLNENGLYDTQRIVYEDGIDRKVESIDHFANEHTKEYLERICMPFVGEMRFIHQEKK
jgi:hypothetical protein